MAKSQAEKQQALIQIESNVIAAIRQHARSRIKTEICGVLIGANQGGQVVVHASIPAVNASEAGTHVTFTQDSWEHIYKTKDKEYPDDRIIGWYHSHPGFGVFLSEHDTFIHQNFFSGADQIAWVFDPHSEEEGCFGWVNGEIQRIHAVKVTYRPGSVESAVSMNEKDIEELDEAVVLRTDEIFAVESEKRSSVPAWLRWTVQIFAYLSVFLLGFVLAYVLFPKIVPVPVPVDPATGRPLSLDVGPAPAQAGAPASETQAPKANNTQPQGSSRENSK